MGRRGDADVARRADLEIELVVRPDGEELPAMGLIFRQVVVDNDRLRRVVEVVLDLFDLRNSGELRDVQCAVLEGEAVWPIQPRVDRLDLALSAPVDDGIDLVEQAAADEHRALVPLPQRARIAYARRIELDLEALRRLQLLERQLVGSGRNWRRCDWRKRDPNRRFRPPLSPGRSGGRSSWGGCRGGSGLRRRLLRNCRPSGEGRGNGSGAQQSAPDRSV